MPQAKPTQEAIQQTFKRHGVMLSEYTAALVTQAIANNIDAQGGYTLNKYAKDAGVLLVLFDAENNIVDTSRFMANDTNNPKRRVPSLEWLTELFAPLWLKPEVYKLTYIREQILTHVTNGGTWETKLCNGYVEVLFYNCFEKIVMAITARSDH
jgi:hypothetical protein